MAIEELKSWKETFRLAVKELAEYASLSAKIDNSNPRRSLPLNDIIKGREAQKKLAQYGVSLRLILLGSNVNSSTIDTIMRNYQSAIKIDQKKGDGGKSVLFSVEKFISTYIDPLLKG